MTDSPSDDRACGSAATSPALRHHDATHRSKNESCARMKLFVICLCLLFLKKRRFLLVFLLFRMAMGPGALADHPAFMFDGEELKKDQEIFRIYMYTS
jgi:hypothetical protein